MVVIGQWLGKEWQARMMPSITMFWEEFAKENLMPGRDYDEDAKNPQPSPEEQKAQDKAVKQSWADEKRDEQSKDQNG